MKEKTTACLLAKNEIQRKKFESNKKELLTVNPRYSNEYIILVKPPQLIVFLYDL